MNYLPTINLCIHQLHKKKTCLINCLSYAIDDSSVQVKRHLPGYRQDFVQPTVWKNCYCNLGIGQKTSTVEYNNLATAMIIELHNDFYFADENKEPNDDVSGWFTLRHPASCRQQISRHFISLEADGLSIPNAATSRGCHTNPVSKGLT